MSYMDVVRLHDVWRLMKRRCEDPRVRQYPWYGERGISVCEEWHDFEAFAAWCFSHGYEQGVELDRIDVNGNYEPGNCRFVDRATNMRNTRRAILVTAFGETKTVRDWVDDPRCAVGYFSLNSRVKRGWDHERALTQPVKVAA